MRTLRAALTAVAVVGSTAAVVAAGTGPAAADTVSGSTFLPIGSVSTMLVDPVHKRVLIADGQNAKLAVTTYSGALLHVMGGLPGVDGLALSADAEKLYAAVPGQGSIYGIDLATMTTTVKYALPGVSSPRTLARVGSTLYFGNSDEQSGGGFGAVDLTTGAVTTNLQRGGGNVVLSEAPELLTAPDAPGRLVLVDESTDAATGGDMYVYDVSGSTPVLRASNKAPKGFVRAAALSRDGSTITAVGPPCRTFVAPVANPFEQTDTYEQQCGGTAVDIDPDDGRVVLGYSSVDEPDVVVYPAGSTTAEQRFDLPAVRAGEAADLLDTVVSEPGGPRLFAVSHNQRSEFHLWVLDEPARIVPVITLAAPATLPRDTGVTFLGTVTAVPAGTKLSVTRTDPASPSGAALADVTVDAQGRIRVQDTPRFGGGDVTYTVSYAGNDVFAPATATATIVVPRKPVSLIVKPDSVTTSYGTTVTFEATIDHDWRPGEVIEIYADPYGADLPPKLIKRTTASANRGTAFSLVATRNVGLTVNYLGTAALAPTTRQAYVYTKVAVSTVTNRQYKTANIGTVSYAHFRKTVDPYVTTTMTAHPGRKARLQFEVHSGGAWKPWKTVDTSVNTAGKSYYTLTGTHSTGVFYRVRSAYLPSATSDSVNFTTYGAYRYFTFTN